MIEFNAAGAFGALRDCWRNYLHRRIQQLEDAFAGGHGRLQDVVFFAEVHDGAEEAQSVLDEGDQHAQFGRSAHQAECEQRLPIKAHGDTGHGNASHHADAAEPDHAGNRYRGENIDRGIVKRVSQDRVFVGVHVAAINL